jgi:hypothetical protein
MAGQAACASIRWHDVDSVTETPARGRGRDLVNGAVALDRYGRTSLGVSANPLELLRPGLAIANQLRMLWNFAPTRRHQNAPL